MLSPAPPNERRTRPPSLLTPLLLALHPLHAAALTITVNLDDDVYPTPLGTTLREAIDAANSGDTIVFHAALDDQTITLSPALGPLAIGKDLTIDASALPGGLTLSAGNAVPSVIEFFDLAASGFDIGALINLTLADSTGRAIGNISGSADITSLILTDCTIRNCGGILYAPIIHQLTMTDCVITQNQGGSTINLDAIIGNHILTGCSFTHNTSSQALFLYRQADFSVEDCLFENNQADCFVRQESGAVNTGDLILHDSSFLNNAGAIVTFEPPGPSSTTAAQPSPTPPLAGSAALDAGNNSGAPATDQRGFPRITDSDNNGTATINIGAVESVTPLTLTRCLVQDNTTSTSGGGAIYAGNNTTVTINYSCLFRNSTTGGGGGAIRIGEGSHLATTRSTIAKNRTAGIGSALYAAGAALNPPSGDLRYTTIGENHSNSAGGAAYLVTGNFEFTHCTIFRNTGGWGLRRRPRQHPPRPHHRLWKPKRLRPPLLQRPRQSDLRGPQPRRCPRRLPPPLSLHRSPGRPRPSLSPRLARRPLPHLPPPRQQPRHRRRQSRRRDLHLRPTRLPLHPRRRRQRQRHRRYRRGGGVQPRFRHHFRR